MLKYLPVNTKVPGKICHVWDIDPIKSWGAYERGYTFCWDPHCMGTPLASVWCSKDDTV